MKLILSIIVAILIWGTSQSIVCAQAANPTTPTDAAPARTVKDRVLISTTMPAIRMRFSDGSRARAFLESKGYRIGDEVLSQRLVHLVDEAKRNELMIIYLEDMSAMGLTAADVSPGGRAAAQWDQISKELLERALKQMQVVRSGRK
ncbi:MAG: hypothetical protein ACREBG_12640 [Pyrinomonadaceae bacterium]